MISNTQQYREQVWKHSFKNHQTLFIKGCTTLCDNTTQEVQVKEFRMSLMGKSLNNTKRKWKETSYPYYVSDVKFSCNQTQNVSQLTLFPFEAKLYV